MPTEEKRVDQRCGRLTRTCLSVPPRYNGRAMSVEIDVTALLDDARSGDAAAREKLAQFGQEVVAGYVSRRMGPSDRRWAESQDIVQQVVFEVIHGLERFPTLADRSALVARLIQTARSRIIDLHRKYKNDIGASIAGETHEVTAPSESMGAVTRADQRRYIDEIVSSLPAKYAEVVRARAIEGLSFVSIGERVGLPADTVRRRYDRIIERVALRLASLRDD